MLFHIFLLASGLFSRSLPDINVRLGLKAEWGSPSLGEDQFIKDESRNQFELISWLKGQGYLDEESDQALFDFLIGSDHFQSEYLGNGESLELLKVYIASHANAPAIQTIYQHYASTKHTQNCTVWVEWGGKHICDPLELDLESFESWEQSKLLTFDHKYDESKKARTAILYANIYDHSYLLFQETLTKISGSRTDFSFVLRFIPNIKRIGPVYISGYGVELALKNNEYKLSQDREEERLENEDSIPIIRPLSEAQLVDIAAIAIQTAQQSSSPFKNLVRLSTDFPKISHLLKANGSIRDISGLGVSLSRTVTGGEQLLFLNGKAIDVERLNAYEVLDMMNSENRILRQLNSLGITTPEALILLSNPKAVSEGNSFNTFSERTVWMNDLEVDARYGNYPDSIDFLLMPTQPGQFRFIRKNLFSVEFYVDLTNQAHLEIILKVYQIIQQGAPLRFGFIPIINSGSSDASIGISNAVVEIIVQEKTKLQSFLMELYTQGVAKGIISKETIQSAFQTIIGRSLDSGAPDQELIDLNLRMGVTESGAIFANGMHFELSAEWTQSVVPKYFTMMDLLTLKLREGLVHSDDNIYKFFLGLPNVYQSRKTDIFGVVDTIILKRRDILDLKWESDSQEVATVSLILFLDLSSDLGKRTLAEARSLLSHPAVKVRIHSVDTSVRNALIDIAGVRKGQSGCIINARLVIFTSPFLRQDFNTLVEFEVRERDFSSSIANIFKNKDTETVADSILLVTSVLSADKSPRVDLTKFYAFSETDIAFKVTSEGSPFNFVSAVLPLSLTGQKLVSFLDRISSVRGVSVLLLACGPPLEQPLTRFYQFILATEPFFTSDGGLVPTQASFTKMPNNIMTLGMDVPGAWLIRPKTALYDLDNIQLTKVDSVLLADFRLEYLLVEGHASDIHTSGPPRGLEFTLSTEQDLLDTMTMANLGYLQFKAAPGMWKLNIRPGRSKEVYQLQSGSEDVILDSFKGVTLYPKVSKKKGMEDQDVLIQIQHESVWQKLKGKMFGKLSKNKTINVFSVASGHLYERFIAIMMLSVKRQTKNPVKFWLIENFLSPSFLEFLPSLADKYDFEFEFVTYKWPHWLRKQTEKQRIIWGYKILFLDVLFPLSLEKVIFVDADQVVRADLIELVDMDLRGAVYGYTPFCSSRKEMDGFRFWISGYWERHLAGRPYHISALYVIDLVRFRALAAGDRLRGQYHMLSADPNSLSNLDQDLPNNMIHEIPIFSLPQDWLWCETWCSDESLKTAKTIDLCNNPQTKEPKLDRARRILPEWTGLDNEVKIARDTFEASKERKAGTLKVDAISLHEEL